MQSFFIQSQIYIDITESGQANLNMILVLLAIFELWIWYKTKYNVINSIADFYIALYILRNRDLNFKGKGP